MKVEIWAAGTYNLKRDSNGELVKDAYGYYIPVALKNAKPILVNVKVTIK